MKFSSILFFSLPESTKTCSLGGLCGIMSRLMSFWENLGTNAQLAIQFISVLVVFYLLSKIVACMFKKKCASGCSCDCGSDCNCKKDNQE